MDRHRLRRRDVIATSLSALTLAALGCRPSTPDVNKPSQAARAPAKRPARRDAVDLAVVEGDDHLAALARAVALAGGLAHVAAGDVALVKVNTNSGDPYPYSSSPAAVTWLVRALVDRGAHVVVGDRSFWGDPDTLENLEHNGIAAAARAAGAEVHAFEPDAVDWTELAPDLVPTWRPPVRVPALFFAAEHVFDLACMKTHFITGATLSMKNLLGIVHPDDRAREGNLRSHHQERIYRQIREIHAAVRPTFTIVDGHRALITGGPTPESGATPTIASVKTVIAGPDRLSCDAFALAMLRRHAPASEDVTRTAPWQNPLLVAAQADAPRAIRARLESVSDADDYLAAARDGAPMPIAAR